MVKVLYCFNYLAINSCGRIQSRSSHFLKQDFHEHCMMIFTSDNIKQPSCRYTWSLNREGKDVYTSWRQSRVYMKIFKKFIGKVCNSSWNYLINYWKVCLINSILFFCILKLGCFLDEPSVVIPFLSNDFQQRLLIFI